MTSCRPHTEFSPQVPTSLTQPRLPGTLGEGLQVTWGSRLFLPLLVLTPPGLAVPLPP